MNRYRLGPWRSFLTFVCLAFLITGVSTQGQGQGRAVGRDTVDGYDVVAGEVLVKFRGQDDRVERGVLANQLDLDVDEEVGSVSARRMHSRLFDTHALLAFFRAHPNVEYVEPNYILTAIALPNDPKLAQLWGLRNLATPGADIHAEAAWDISTGTRNAVVAVVDTGVDYNHPDLASNIWAAPSDFTVTIGGVDILCRAGTHGFNAITKTCDPLDDNAHGTHVSGTIGAVGDNNVGVVGVNWATQIMGAKFLSASGSGSTTDAINAIEFAIQAKNIFGAAANVRVLSNSWGGGGFSQALLNEINKANTNDMLFVAAAGNSGRNNDARPSYPASYNAANVVAVAATDSLDRLASFSNYGASSVDLGAPGVGILSTTPNNTYSTYDGTSMATPHVSGAAMLVLSACSLNTQALKNNLLANVDSIAALSTRTATGGRLNVDRSIRACASGGPVTPPASAPSVSATPGDGQVTLSWSAVTGATSYNIKRGEAAGDENFDAGSTPATSFTDSGLTDGTQYFYVVTAHNSAGDGPASTEVSATPVAPPVGDTPEPPTGLSANPGPGAKKISLSWTPPATGGVSSYNVLRSACDDSFATIATGVLGTSYANTGLTSGRTYCYVVKSVGSTGLLSGPSTTASATAR